MGNLCLPKRSREIQKKFDAGEVLRPCQKHLNLNHRKKYAVPDLIDAMNEGHLTCVKALIDAGADVNEMLHSFANCTPLHCHPVMLGPEVSGDPNHGFAHYMCVKSLIEAGADVNAVDPVGWKGTSPLLEAAEHGHDKCVELLIEAGADKNYTDKERGHTALMKATFNGRFKCIQALVRAGADVNKGDETKRTPLHSLASLGYDKCLKFLIDSGADISAKTEYGATPLDSAVGSKQSRCLDLLIKAGADVNTITGGTTPLFTASFEEMFRSSVPCIKLLLRAGSIVNVFDEYGQNAIRIYITHHRVHKENFDEGVMLLYAAGETVDGAVVERFHHSWSPLYSVDVPIYILHLKELRTLKEIARNAARNYLLELNHQKNLFCILSNLQFPSILKSYLLFDMSIE